MGLRDATEQHGHDTRQRKHLRDQARRVGHQHTQRGLQQRMLPNAREFGQQRGNTTHERANQKRGSENTKEIDRGHNHVGCRVGTLGRAAHRLILLVVLQCLHKDNCHGVVQHALAKDKGVQGHVDVKVVKDGEHGDRIRGGDEGPEMQVINKRDVVEVRYELTHPVHEPADAERRHRRAHEGKRKYGSDVAEKVTFFHGVAGVEYYGRQ